MKNYDVIVIGGGPAGYEAAAMAAADGNATLLVERGELGGTCLNRGCIPTKSFCRSAEVALTMAGSNLFGIGWNGAMRIDMPAIVARKNAIVEQLREGVTAIVSRADTVAGNARFVGSNEISVSDETFTAPRIIIATGSEAARLPIEGAGLALTSTEMLNLSSVPASLAIIGGGVIGMEFASIFAALGSDVTVIEYCREILPPFDKDIAKRLRTTLQKRGVKFHLSAEVRSVTDAGGVMKSVTFTSKGKELVTEAETVLMAVGRRAVVPEGAVEAGIKISRRGIEVDSRFETSVPGVFAIGDCNGICQLAHAASAQAELVMGRNADLSVIPSAVFTVPECAMAGMTEEQCREQGVEFCIGKSFFRANGKAMTMGETDGMIKMLVDRNTGLILGCHICGAHASDLIAEVALAMSARLTVSGIVSTIHSHPSLSEALRAAACAASA